MTSRPTRLLQLINVQIGTALALVAIGAAGGCAERRDSAIDRMVSQVDRERIEATVRALAACGTRNTMSSQEHPTRGIGAARRWIVGQLERINADCGGRLLIEENSFMYGPDGRRITRETEIVNIVATLPGVQPESRERYFVVSGHYDSICSDPTDAECDAPGANDDASGCAVVLEACRVLSTREFDASLIFMFVAGEEQGLIGSRHWAKAARERGQNIAGMFTNDIVGSSRGSSGADNRGRVRLFSEGTPMPPPGESPAAAGSRGAASASVTSAPAGGGSRGALFPASLYESDAPARQLARLVFETQVAYVPDFEVWPIFRRDRFLRGGDHTAFSEQGYAAIRFTEFEENFDHQHQNVRVEDGRQYGDLVEFCDFAYIADVTRVNVAALAALASAPAPPSDVRIITAGLTNDTTLRWSANAEPDLAGYEIVWRDTAAPMWHERHWAGNVTEVTLPVSKDNVAFGVRAVDREGHISPAVAPAASRE